MSFIGKSIFIRYPLTSRLALFILMPVLVATLVAWWHLQRSLPIQEGRLAVSGLAHEVQIARDAHGVPRIQATTDRDAYFAIGYLHAQDRMWQLEVQRRIARGRLSEIFGKDSVDADIWFRTLGLDQAAHASWPKLSPQAQASLQAYADGINQWLASDPVLPPEFILLGIRPEPWTVYDSLAWVKVFALDLGGNHQREIERLLVAQAVDAAKVHDLFPSYPADAAKTVAELTVPQRGAMMRYAGFQRRVESQLQIGGRFVGSNAWAVSGRLTGDGSALLANDPHLGLQIPSLWYMASIKGSQLDVQGATLVGLPLVVFGRNRHIAWGGTNLMADAQDLYFEQVKPDDITRYSVDGRWQSFAVREELIRVRQPFPAFLRNPLQPVRISVRTTRHGPIISDLFTVLDQPASLRWTALDPDDASYEAFYRLGYARNWTEFQEALRHLVAPALNMLYADRGGNIGYLAAGRMPIRESGDGSMPVAGWTDTHEWKGWIPFENWPRSYNPASGLLVSANNKPVDDDYPYLITQDWAPPSRANRITRLLERARASGQVLNAETMRRIQADDYSEPAHRMVARLLRYRPRTEQQRRAQAQLAAWDGRMRADSPAATLFNVWTRALKRELLLDDLHSDWNRADQTEFLEGVVDDLDLDSLQRMLAGNRSDWCDDRRSARLETCDDVLGRSLDAALQELSKVYSDSSMQAWDWGGAHETVYRHTPFSDLNVLRSIFQRSIGNGGSPDTVNVANYRLEPAGRYVQTFGAGFRQVFVMAPQRSEHLYMASTGQSGNVLSPHYDDMIEPFRDVRLLRMPVSGAAGARVLTLTPASGASERAK